MDTEWLGGMQAIISVSAPGNQMRPMRPMTKQAAALLLAGASLAVVAALVRHDAWTVRGICIWFAAGTILGTLILKPIAMAQVERSKQLHWLGRHAFRFHWYASLTMAAAVGYLLATIRQSDFDILSGLALVLVLTGATIKTVIKIQFEHGERRAPSR